MNNEIKFDHFKNLEELKQNVENWLATDEIYWERWFGLGDIKTLLDCITNLQEDIETYRIQSNYFINRSDDLEEENEDLKDYLDIFKLSNKTKQETIDDFRKRVDKAVEILKDTSVDMPETLLIETIDYARYILTSDNE